eukprot:4206532-Pleurochrysis_carterae.AAC.2
MLHAVDGLGHGEHAWIRFALSETEIEQPREERTLPAPARLRHSPNGFLDAVDARPSVGAEGGVSRRRVTVDHLVLLQITLHVNGDKIPTPHAHAGRAGDRRERA